MERKQESVTTYTFRGPLEDVKREVQVLIGQWDWRAEMTCQFQVTCQQEPKTGLALVAVQTLVKTPDEPEGPAGRAAVDAVAER